MNFSKLGFVEALKFTGEGDSRAHSNQSCGGPLSAGCYRAPKSCLRPRNPVSGPAASSGVINWHPGSGVMGRKGLRCCQVLLINLPLLSTFIEYDAWGAALPLYPFCPTLWARHRADFRRRPLGITAHVRPEGEVEEFRAAMTSVFLVFGHSA